LTWAQFEEKIRGHVKRILGELNIALLIAGFYLRLRCQQKTNESTMFLLEMVFEMLGLLVCLFAVWACGLGHIGHRF
jgi:hypothetical protein